MSTFKQLRVVVLFVAVALLVLSVPNLFAQDDASSDDVTEFTITMSEYKFEVDGLEAGEPLELEVGKPYRLTFVHAGTLEHELLIGQNAILIEEGIHHDFEAALLGDVEVSISGLMNDEDFVIGVAGLEEFEMNPGQELSIEFTLPEEKIGEWEAGCFIFLAEDATIDEPSPSHFDAGMHLTINVVESME